MRLSLYTLIGLSVLGGVGVAVALTVGLTHLKADENLLRLSESRYAFIASQVEARVSTGFGLGLDLSSQTNLDAVMIAVLQENPRLVSVEIFDRAGKVLYAAGRGGERLAVPDKMRAAIIARPMGQGWASREDEHLVVGLPLVNTYGKTEGGLLLMSGRDALDDISRSMLHDILRGCLAVAAGAAGIAALAMVAVFHRTRVGFGRAAAALDGQGSPECTFDPLASACVPAPTVPVASPDPLSPGLVCEVERAVGAFRERVTAGWRAIEDAQRHLDALDPPPAPVAPSLSAPSLSAPPLSARESAP